MGDYTRSYKEDYVRPSPGLLWEDYETTQSAFGASAALNFHNYGVTSLLAKEAKVALENGFTDYFLYGEIQDETELSPFVTPEEATQRGEQYGMSFKKPIRQSVLDLRIKNRRDELTRQSIVNRSESGGAKFFGGLAGAIADPANIAASFIPIVREARFAQMTARLGGVGRARVARGVIEGTVGSALLEIPTIPLTARAQADYDMYDSMMNITFGGIMGGGLHFGGGYVKDRFTGRVTENAIPERIDATNIETKQTALRTAFADMMQGRAVEVEPILRSDDGFNNWRQRQSDTPASWVIRNKETGEVISETFESGIVQKLNTDKYEAIPIIDYLEGLNKTIDNLETKIKERGVDVSISESADSITLSKITVPEDVRNKGAGTRAMNELLEYADQKSKKVTLSPSADFGGSKPRLVKFYKKFGFVENKGKNKDFSTQESMYREPKAITRPVAPKDTRPDLGNVTLRQFAESKSGKSALSQEADAREPFVPDSRYTDDSGIDNAVNEAIDGIEDLQGFFDNADPATLKLLNIEPDQIKRTLDALDADIAEAEKFSDAVKAFGACMMR